MNQRFLSRSGALVVLMLLAAGAAGAWAGGIERRVALLLGDQEVPPVATAAFGCATLEIDTCTNTLSYYITYGGLSSAESAAHIHGASLPGVNAGVLHPLPAGNPKVGVWNYPQSREADLLEGRMYVNVHTAMHGGGEIRGQIVTHVAILDGDQENPPTGSAGTGWAVGNLDPDAMTLSYHVVFGGLGTAETAAHIHGISAHGTNSGVLHPLPAGSPKVGAWNYAAAQEQAILDGSIYINVHSVGFGGGEIRGQFTPLVVPIDSTQETPPLAIGSAAGCGLFSLNRPVDELGYDIRSTGLTTAETAAHIHGYAARGVPVGVVHPLPAGARKLGVWNYPAANEGMILDGLTYVNIHTAMHGGGEIRGQIDFFPPTPCPGDLDCNGVVDLTDLAIQLANFGTTVGATYCDGDIDGDGDIDLTDLALLLAVFGTSC